MFILIEAEGSAFGEKYIFGSFIALFGDRMQPLFRGFIFLNHS